MAEKEQADGRTENVSTFHASINVPKDQDVDAVVQNYRKMIRNLGLQLGPNDVTITREDGEQKLSLEYKAGFHAAPQDTNNAKNSSNGGSGNIGGPPSSPPPSGDGSGHSEDDGRHGFWHGAGAKMRRIGSGLFHAGKFAFVTTPVWVARRPIRAAKFYWKNKSKALIGAAAGTFFMPGVGTVIGGIVGPHFKGEKKDNTPVSHP